MLLKAYKFPGNKEIVFKTDLSGEFSPGDPDPNRVEGGYFHGCDVIGLLQHSHKWWLRELSEIAEAIAQ